MKKKLISAVLLTALLCGCAKDADNDRDSREREKEEAVEEEEEEEESGSDEEDVPPEDEPIQAPDVASLPGLQHLQLTVTEQVTDRRAEDGSFLFFGNYPHVNLETPGFDALSSTIDRLNTSLYTEAEDMASEYISQFVEGMNDTYCGCAETTMSVCRADEGIVSLLEYIYTDFGGVHPNYYYHSIALDPVTGDLLGIDDVLQSGQEENLAQYIEDDLYARYDREIFFSDVSEGVEDMIGMTGLVFTVGYDSLKIYFSPYELAAHAFGDFIVELPYEDYPGLVKDEYLEIPDNYMMKVTRDNEIRLSDGRRFNWAIVWDEEDFTMDSLSLTCDGEEQALPLAGFNLAIYLAHVDGNEYLFIDQTVENDAHMMEVIDLNEDELKVLNDDYPMVGFYTAPYDPERIQLSTRSYRMSTYRIWQHSSIQSNGDFKPLEDYYYIASNHLDFVLTLKQDLTVEYREEFSDTETEQLDLAAGNQLSFYATDNDTYVDFLLEGRGGYVRIYLDDGEAWPQTVDGTDIEDLFEGLLFAG